MDRFEFRKCFIVKVRKKVGSLRLDEVSSGADCFLHVMVAVASGSETFVTRGALERLHVEMDS